MEGGSEENAETVEDILDFTVDVLDDKEFDLPQVNAPLSLESILNEPEADNVFEAEITEDLPDSLKLLTDGFNVSLSETTSIASNDDKPTPRKKKTSVIYEQHGSILRRVVMRNISQQLTSASDRVDAGMPTSLAVSSLIAVGTSHGLVLVFNPEQVLKWCLGSKAVGSQFGAVSALSFNRDCTRLLCGFARGQITMYDLTNGKLLRTITDAHPPGSAILHVKFTDDLTIAICNDSGGSVFELEFKRLIGVRTCESKCLFSGSRGEVCAIEPLHMNHTIKDHPMKDVSILAMASLSKVLIVTLKPELKVKYTQPLKGDPGTLPLLAWQFVMIQVSEKEKVIDPVLAFGRDKTMFFFQVICTGPDSIKFVCLRTITVSYTLLQIQWMNPRTLVAMDKSERCHVIDVKSGEELEVLDIGDVELVYSSSYFKSLATGGNVSKALAHAGEHACYQSMATFGGKLFLLGMKSIHIMNMRTWKERLDVLVREQEYQQALNLGLSFYNSKAKAVVGLSGQAAKRRQAIEEKMLAILFEYVDISMTTNCPEHGKMEELEQYYQTVVPVCVDYCLLLKRVDVLFTRIYDRFQADIIAKGQFLECLEPYILNDQLTLVTPAIMKGFIDQYQSKGLLQRVEACIVHLDVASLDIHQIVLLCWEHGLYDAIIYVYNKGMDDFTTPLEQLLLRLQQAIATGKQLTDDHIKLGNKLLVYISCCLAGRAYPIGDIADNLVSQVKENVFQCVLRYHTEERDLVTNKPAYSHLRTLLQFNTREFLNVLALAFEEPEFTSSTEKRQEVVDILLRVMVENVGFSPSQIGTLFTFLARQMARHEDTISVQQSLFDQVLEFLCAPEDDSRHEERQQALLELLNAGGLQEADDSKVLMLAEQAQFYRVCELLYEKRREFDKILSCYWRDAARRHQAFSYITNITRSKTYTDQEKLNVEKEALLHLQELVEIDSWKTAKLIFTGFTVELADIVKQLEGNRELLFKFLDGVFKYRESSGSALHSEKQIQVEASIHELFIDLMCQYNENHVYTYILSADGYRLEQTLKICRRHKNSEATAFLLEKIGDVQAAFDIILENIQGKISIMLKHLHGKEHSEEDILKLNVLVSEVDILLLFIIQLCQRSSSKLDETGRKKLWFPLLETFMNCQRNLKEDVNKEYLEKLKGLTRYVLSSMMGYIDLPAILQKLMQDPTYSSGKFGEFKDLLLGMLDTYNYEKTLLHTCNNLLNRDLHLQMCDLQKVAKKAFGPTANCCPLCKKEFNPYSDSEQIVIFRCEHLYHTKCLSAQGAYHVVDGDESWVCYVCNNATRGRLKGGRLISTSTSGREESSSANKIIQPQLNPQQEMALENLRRTRHTSSRFGILEELRRSENRRKNSRSSTVIETGQFQLKLAPPPIDHKN